MQITSKEIIPLLLIMADIIQSIICIFHKDYARALYWFAAGLITAASIIM